MDYTKLGHTGLDVSRICLGCMTYGVPERGNHLWSLDEEKSRPFIRRALEMGINFFDTANVYSDGTSEEFLGRAIRDFSRREEVVIATKVHGRMRPGPNGAGLSRRAILAEIEEQPALPLRGRLSLRPSDKAAVLVRAGLARTGRPQEPVASRGASN